jgi:hypothetical protein
MHPPHLEKPHMTTDARILAIAKAVRSDAWVDLAARGAYSVGFANNAGSVIYNKSMETLAARLKAEGLKVSSRSGDEVHACTIVTVRA